MSSRKIFSLGLILWLPMGATPTLADDGAGYDETAYRIKNDKPEGYGTYPLISIPLSKGDAKKIQYHQMILTKDKSRDPKLLELCKKSEVMDLLDAPDPYPALKTFKTVKVRASTSLEINSYLVTENFLHAKYGFKRGPSAPTLKEIQKSLDSSDSETFLKILARLSEERRAPQTPKDVHQVEKMKDKDMDPCTQIFFGSGFFEVSGKNITPPKGAPSDLLYFVRTADILKGKAKLDLKKAKLQVLKGLTVYLFQKIGDDYQDMGDEAQNAQEAKIQSLYAETQSICDGKGCKLSDTEKLGSLGLQMMEIFTQEGDQLLEPEVGNRLVMRQQLCLLQKTLKACGKSATLKKVNALVGREGMDCDRPRSLLKGL